MKVVSLSLDPKILDPENTAARRVQFYGSITDVYTVVVPTDATKTVRLRDNVLVIGTGGKHKLARLWYMYRIVQRLIAEGKCDVITSQDVYFLGLLGYVFSRRYHIGLEVQVLGIEKLSALRKLLARFVLARAGSIRVLSERIKTQLLSTIPMSDKRMLIVPIYVDVTALGFDEVKQTDAERAKLKLEKEKFQTAYGQYFNFVSVSRLVTVKNIPLQLQAIKMLKDEFPHIRLHLVGDGPERQRLTELASLYGIQDYIIFHGAKYGVELSPFFTQTDCFLLTSFSEGWGMVIVEAAMAGLPVVMTEVGCAGELIKDGESGIVIPIRNGQALIDAMRRMLTDVAYRTTLGEGAKRSATTLPTLDDVLAQYRASWQSAYDNRV
jgi:glycosyltransferase involved in cell wall biosynthesis